MWGDQARPGQIFILNSDRWIGLSVSSNWKGVFSDQTISSPPSPPVFSSPCRGLIRRIAPPRSFPCMEATSHPYAIKNQRKASGGSLWHNSATGATLGGRSNQWEQRIIGAGPMRVENTAPLHSLPACLDVAVTSHSDSSARNESDSPAESQHNQANSCLSGFVFNLKLFKCHCTGQENQ